jgi:hypothetical protein
MRPIARRACAAALLTLTLGSTGAAAQRARPTSSPPRLRVYGIVDFNALAARESFDAVLGTSHLTAFGGGVDIVDIWKHVFVRVDVTHASQSGERVFVSGGQVFPLGIPLTVTMTPIEAGGGWRFVSSRRGRRPSRVVPYVGAAFLSMGYEETSKFAEASENTSERFAGQTVFGGAEVGLTKWLVAAGEGQYRRVPNALGAGAVSKDFGESDLGGFTARITIGIRK